MGGVPKAASRLNTVLPNAGVDRVEFAKFAPSSQAALYLAAQETSGKLEVYSANVADPGNWRKLNSVLGAGGAIPKTPFPRWAPDSSRVAYIAEESKSGTSAPGPGLYLVDMLQSNATGKKVGSSSCTRPNTGAAWTCQGVKSFEFSP